MLDRGRLERLLDGAAPEVLRPLLEPGARRDHVVTAPGSSLMQSLADKMFTRTLNGPLRRLMMEGMVLQLLALQAAAASEQAPARHIDGLRRPDAMSRRP
jgi:hypothetical protein